jgi:DNA modification methylase
MQTGELFQKQRSTSGEKPRNAGPPNRMNDLVYRDWMKFQKSFFFHVSAQALVEECIYFFTKAMWPDGSPSRSLILGVDNFNANAVISPRIVDSYRKIGSLNAIVELLDHLRGSGIKYDFLLVDLRSYLRDRKSLNHFLSDYSDGIFSDLRSLLAPKRYGCVLVGTEKSEGNGFPLPWAIALSSRRHLKLRDEKIGLMERERRLFYCLLMQAEEDERSPNVENLKGIHIAKAERIIPGWIIPKPPPRKRNEILHPAKYPETLVSEFIERFTKPGDNVLDPMVGTGSTVLAALRARRNGYGIDLIPQFVEIARKRITDEFRPVLFEKLQHSSKSLVLQGDATRLSEIPELVGVKFHYAVTSPPYWSMLTNKGSEYQEDRRKKNLLLTYSQDDRDLGNVGSYDRFLELLESVYNQVAEMLVKGGHLTVVVKNVKRNHVIYPLAWDLVSSLCGEGGKYDYVGTTLWCQDDVGIKPFAVGIHWVSNTLHHYCLHFRKRSLSQK